MLCIVRLLPQQQIKAHTVCKISASISRANFAIDKSHGSQTQWPKGTSPNGHAVVCRQGYPGDREVALELEKGLFNLIIQYRDVSEDRSQIVFKRLMTLEEEHPGLISNLL